MPGSSFISGELTGAFEARGHEVDLRYYGDLSIEIGSDRNISFGGEQIGNYGAAILRMAEGKSMIWYKDILTRHLMEHNIPVINGASFVKFPHLGKLVQNFELSRAHLPVVSTRLYSTKDQALQGEKDFPVMVKPNFGRLGEGIVKAHHGHELEITLGERATDYLIQDFLPTAQDYRIIVIGGRALPRMMKKKAREGSHVTNFSQGGIVTSEDTTPELADLAERAAAVFESDYCGVDIMYDEHNKPHILEINRSANFKGYHQATGDNVPLKLVEHVESLIGKTKI